MSLRVEIVPDPEEGGFTACIPDIPAYGEGAAQDEAIEDLKEALRAFISVVGLDDARSRILRDVGISPHEFEELWNNFR